MKYAESTAAVAPDQDHRILSLGNVGEGLLHLGCGRRLLTVHALNDLTGLQTSFVSGAAGLHALNHCTLQARGGLQLLAHVRGEIADADPPAWLTILGPGAEIFLLLLRAEFFECDRHIDTLAVAEDVKTHLGSGTLRADFSLELSGVGDFLPVESDDHIAYVEAGARTGRISLYFADDCAVGVVQIEEL